MAAISLAPGMGLSKMDSRQSAVDLANAEYRSLVKNKSEKRILRVLNDISEGPSWRSCHLIPWLQIDLNWRLSTSTQRILTVKVSAVLKGKRQQIRPNLRA